MQVENVDFYLSNECKKKNQQQFLFIDEIFACACTKILVLIFLFVWKGKYFSTTFSVLFSFLISWIFLLFLLLPSNKNERASVQNFNCEIIPLKILENGNFVSHFVVAFKFYFPQKKTQVFLFIFASSSLTQKRL